MIDEGVVILLGAGATYGAGHIVPSQASLGWQLYDRLAAKYPRSWGPASRLGRYAQSFRRDFEKTLSDEVLEWEPALCMLEWHRDVARYFAEFAPAPEGDDCYSKLLRSLQSASRLQNVAVGSLNYECVFEIAALRAGIEVACLVEHCISGRLPVLKVHGSCNFVTDDLSRSKPFLTNPGSHLECRFETVPLHDLQQGLESKFRTDRYPVLSFYSPDKRTPVAPAGIQRIRNAWTEVATRARLIAVVGVRFNADDRHVVEPIQQSAASELLYVGSRADFAGWSSLSPHFEHLGETFDGASDVLCSRLAT